MHLIPALVQKKLHYFHQTQKEHQRHEVSSPEFESQQHSICKHYHEPAIRNISVKMKWHRQTRIKVAPARSYTRVRKDLKLFLDIIESNIQTTTQTKLILLQVSKVTKDFHWSPILENLSSGPSQRVKHEGWSYTPSSYQIKDKKHKSQVQTLQQRWDTDMLIKNF